MSEVEAGFWNNQQRDHATVLGDQLRTISVVTVHDEHPGVVIVVSDTVNGACLSVVLDGPEAILFGSAILEGGNWVRVKDAERKEAERGE